MFCDMIFCVANYNWMNSTRVNEQFKRIPKLIYLACIWKRTKLIERDKNVNANLHAMPDNVLFN